ncbi:MAG TPA: hypothetical protein VKA73_09840 [Rubrobacter sp.]|nr:hypothetical protein [Rubrobacter sp.]
MEEGGMGAGSWDTGRRWAAVIGALFQVLAGMLVPIAEIATAVPSLVIPAGYAFAIWGPIFLLGLVYSAHQMLLSRRGDPLLRRVGWPLAGAFLLNGMWEISVLLRQPVLLQVIITGILACAAVAFVRLVRSDKSSLKKVDLWLVAPTIALLFGWITAANVVSFNDMLVELGLLGTGLGSALVGGALLILGGLVTSAFVLVGRGDPPRATPSTLPPSSGGWRRGRQPVRHLPHHKRRRGGGRRDRRGLPPGTATRRRGGPQDRSRTPLGRLSPREDERWNRGCGRLGCGATGHLSCLRRLRWRGPSRRRTDA